MTNGEEKVLLASGVWLVLFDLWLLFQVDLVDPFGLLALLWGLLFFWTAVVLGIWALVLLVRSRRKLLPALSLMIPVGALLHACLIGESWVDTLRFQFVRARYEAAVFRFHSTPASQLSASVAEDAEVLTERPLRIAFAEPSSGFCAYRRIVYDPTGLVRQVRGLNDAISNSQHPELARLRELYGVPLYSVEALGGPWYRCDFDLEAD